MMAFMAAHRSEFGVEPMCRVLQIAPSTWYEHARRREASPQLPARARRDAEIVAQIRRVHEANFGVYGARNVWRQLQREGIQVARCPVRRFGERPMRAMGLQGVVRGKPKKTTISEKATPCPLDRVNRQFVADRPNKLWVSDFTYVPIDTGFVYLALVIDVFARTIVGWKVSSTAPSRQWGRLRARCPEPGLPGSPADRARPGPSQR